MSNTKEIEAQQTAWEAGYEAGCEEGQKAYIEMNKFYEEKENETYKIERGEQ